MYLLLHQLKQIKKRNHHLNKYLPAYSLNLKNQKVVHLHSLVAANLAMIKKKTVYLVIVLLLRRKRKVHFLVATRRHLLPHYSVATKTKTWQNQLVLCLVVLVINKTSQLPHFLVIVATNLSKHPVFSVAIPKQNQSLLLHYLVIQKLRKRIKLPRVVAASSVIPNQLIINLHQAFSVEQSLLKQQHQLLNPRLIHF